jgi:hypothetical protein
VAKRRRTAADVFLMITGREASEHEPDDLRPDERGGHCGQGERHAAGAAEREVAQDLDLD